MCRLRRKSEAVYCFSDLDYLAKRKILAHSEASMRKRARESPAERALRLLLVESARSARKELAMGYHVDVACAKPER